VEYDHRTPGLRRAVRAHYAQIRLALLGPHAQTIVQSVLPDLFNADLSGVIEQAALDVTSAQEH
jgi:hypothetical protein